LQELPDFESLRLKLDSLASEKEYVINENSMLKMQVKHAEEKSQKTVVNQREMKVQLTQLISQREEHLEKIALLDKQYGRTKAVAAFMEKQIKELMPNAKIDYKSIRNNQEPSTLLLASILSTSIVKETSFGAVAEDSAYQP
jgi:chromosome segregation ATPase